MKDCCEHPDNLDLTPEGRDEALAGYARALGHPARVKLLRQIAGRRECISAELVESVGLAQSTVSEHLRILREAGLIEAEPQPPRTCYRPKPEAMARLRDLLNSL
ncbi:MULTISPECIES: ArsR/SmtB family transcription factor [Natronospira]|uniref:Winged helix-turn-helix domain-containing protein n=2 Tax=Natronospira TaxID=2024969 RepID=A0AAP6JG77_9GAMM|nr:winged helix-turn-helix domain-containing protein [Natronospira sp. AB-CW4]MDQ2068633.1 winged helix-turn-helix domain-containing protein [Natronospira sp. AB-CW4]MEA5446463.1 winged helix-turn-helix domain-containing protein [Gammaproteobacteria bacterium AB-CW1]